MVERVIDEIDSEACADKDRKNVCYVCGAATGNGNHNSSETTSESAKSSNPSYIVNANKEPESETFSEASFNYKSTKDIVGNSKEFRIEHNKSNLRIIGNSNRIRIGQNSGNIQIIGNTTKLKVINNSGHIKYTGNEGRICLGSESAQQTVEYVGCNGLLKVVNSMELSASASSTKCKSKEKSTEADDNNLPSGSSAATTGKVPPRKRIKVKSASFGGNSAQWDLFNEMFQRHHCQHFLNMSLPNLVKCPEEGKNSRFTGNNCSTAKNNVINQYGSIIIQNSINVKI